MDHLKGQHGKHLDTESAHKEARNTCGRTDIYQGTADNSQVGIHAH